MAISPTEESVLDSATGLPALPDGLFWRVGDFNVKYASGGWWTSSTGSYVPGVGIMKWDDVEKSEETPVFGTRWYNKHIVVSKDIKYWTEKEKKVVQAELFTGHTAYSEKEIPSVGYQTGSMASGGTTKEWHYEITVTPEGTLWLAQKLWKQFESTERYWKNYEAGEAAKKTMRESLYGDYPPKSIL